MPTTTAGDPFHTSSLTLPGVEVSIDLGVATILLNRPETGNAWSLALGEQVATALRWCDLDDSVGIIVLGARGRVFCVGADLSSGQLESSPDASPQPPSPSLLPSQVRKPVIAALHGHTVGVGMTFALHCDLRVVADEGKYGFPFVRRGLVPEFNSTWLLPRVVGLAHAHELLLTGRLVRGSEAVSIGLAHRSVPADSVLASAQEWAAQMCADGSPLAMAATKFLVRSGLDAAPGEHAELEMQVFEELASGADAAEGVSSFLDKRPPKWSGSTSKDWPSALPSGTIPVRRDTPCAPPDPSIS